MTDLASRIQRMDINSMSPQALSQVHEIVSNEIDYLSDSLVALKKAIVKFEAAKEAAEKISKCKTGQKSLARLTDMLYMSGELLEPQKLIVDIGTGYYIEMSIQRAIDFYKRKVNFVQGQLDGLQKIIVDKTRAMTVLGEAYQRKVQQQMISMYAQR